MIDLRNQIIRGDALEALRTLPDGVADCCVTSPPYWGLRDYGVDGQIGLEATPDEFVALVVEVFREVRRVLRDDATLWLNLGDSYAGGGGFAPDAPCNQARAEGREWGALNPAKMDRHSAKEKPAHARRAPIGLKPKDIVGIPWRVAFALQADGWWLRADIIWHKPNPMPESATDRPTKAHEYVFLLSKAAKYSYDAASIAEPLQHPAESTNKDLERAFTRRRGTVPQPRQGDAVVAGAVPATRNARSVWSIASQPFAGAHFATMPRALAERCVLAGSRKGGIVLDPFFGAGTTGLAARTHGRDYLGIELNPDYIKIAEERLNARLPLFGGDA